TRFSRDWSSDVCSSDLRDGEQPVPRVRTRWPTGAGPGHQQDVDPRVLPGRPVLREHHRVRTERRGRRLRLYELTPVADPAHGRPDRKGVVEGKELRRVR